MVEGFLSAATEAALVRQIQNSGSMSSRAWTRLEMAFKPFIDSYIRCIGCDSSEQSGLEQDFRFAFFLAVRKYDPCRGGRLATFARKYMKGVVYRTRKCISSRAVSLDALMDQMEEGGKDDLHPLADMQYDERNSLHRAYVCTEIVDAVRSFVAARPSAQNQLATRMLDFGENETEAAAFLGISRQAASKTWLRLKKAGRAELQAFEKHL